MLLSYHRGATSVVLRVKIFDSAATTGAGKTGLTSASSGLIVSTIANNEASATAYTAGGSTIESISTLGTYATPTATKCRFREVDATNHPGIYEIQVADARFAVSSAKALLVSISGAAGAAQCDALVPLWDIDPYDAVRGGMTALPNAAAAAVGGLLTGPTTANTGLADVTRLLGTAMATPNIAGIPKVDLVDINGSAAAAATGLTLDFTQALPGSPTAGTVGEALKFADTRLDAAVSSRSTFAGGAVASVTATVAANVVQVNGAAVSMATAASIADAVWDEAQADHAAAGTFGGALDARVSTRMATFTVPTNFAALLINASGHVSRVTLVDTVTANTDMRGTDNAALAATALSTATWTNTKAGFIDAAISSVSGGGGGATVDAIWDALRLDHFDAGTMGEALGILMSMVEADGLQYRYTAEALEQAPTGGSAPTASAIADAVWDEVQSGHTTAGTFGKYLDAAVSSVGSGDWTSDEKEQIRYRLTIDGDATEPAAQLDPYVQVDLRQVWGVDIPTSPIAGAPVVALSDGTGAGQVNLNAGAIVSVENVSTVDTLSDKAGFSLAADGLDAVSVAAPDGVAETFREMVVQTWRRWFRKTTMTATQLRTFADDDSTILTSQNVSDDETTQVQGSAS